MVSRSGGNPDRLGSAVEVLQRSRFRRNDGRFAGATGEWGMMLGVMGILVSVGGLGVV